nr:BTB/POZ domain-containing protein [Ipomoea trifida]
MKCVSCKEEYCSRDARTCRECYEEASETVEELKSEIKDLKAKIGSGFESPKNQTKIYLAIYFSILCLSRLVTRLEPLKFFYATSQSTYVGSRSAQPPKPPRSHVGGLRRSVEKLERLEPGDQPGEAENGEVNGEKSSRLVHRQSSMVLCHMGSFSCGLRFGFLEFG